MIDTILQQKALEQRLQRIEKAIPRDIPNIPVVAVYTTNAGQVIPNNSGTVINFEDLLYDTHTAVTVGANWVFTAPVSGYYHISAVVMFTATTTWAATEYANLQPFIGGVGTLYLDRVDDHTSASIYVKLQGSVTLRLSKGDQLDLRVLQASGGNLALHNNGAYNYISIHRI